MAGKLYNLGIPKGHFDLVIIDEAGQAMEPEAISSFAGILKSDDYDGCLIIAGDPK